MRIAIDARLDRTGIGRYTFSLIRELAAIDPRTDYLVFLRRATFDAWTPPAANVHKRLADIPHYSLAEQLHLPGILRRERPDLVHFPHFNVPLGVGCPYVVTLHDLIASTHPNRPGSLPGAVRHGLRRAAYHAVIRRAAARARHVLTGSAFSRQLIVERLRVDPAAVTVTPYGVDPTGFEPPDPGTIARYGITRPFFLYVGAAYPHKNLARLIQAFARFAAGAATRHQLVLAGDLGAFGPALEALAGGLGGDGVLFPGRISDAELSALYQGAVGYAVVSLAEGFGLPGLEAMAHSVPVLASRAGSLPEIYGDAALFVDPGDISDMAAGIARIATDPGLRDTLIARGRRRVLGYPWRRTAEQTLDVYRAAARQA